MLRKPLVGATICAAAILGVGTSAFAGEVTGGGPDGPKDTGMAGHAKSECGYSGQEDTQIARDQGSRTQTPHYVFNDTSSNPDDWQFIYPDPGTPGFACSPGRP